MAATAGPDGRSTDDEAGPLRCRDWTTSAPPSAGARRTAARSGVDPIASAWVPAGGGPWEASWPGWCSWPRRPAPRSERRGAVPVAAGNLARPPYAGEVLTATGITTSHGASPVLDGVSLVVGPRSRIGVVGPNGVGKSTLLRILAGLEEPERGALRRSPPELSVGYLPQEPDARPGETLRAYLARRTGVAAAEAELDRLTAALGEDPSLVEAYTGALERFLALGGDDLGARTAVVCRDGGLPEDRLDVPVAALSGGQAARAELAAILLARFDVF